MNSETTIAGGISMGTALAMLMTWTNVTTHGGWDVFWTIIHGVFGWFYVILWCFGVR